MSHYGTAASVKVRCGVGPDDLGLDDDTALDTFLDELLDEFTDLANRMMGTDYTTSTVPAGLNGIANDAVANSVREMMVSRQTPVVRIDDFAVRSVAPRLLADDIVKRLRRYSTSALSTLDVTPGDILGVRTDITAASLDTMDNDA